MKQVTINVCGKINPALDIVGKQKNGYHLISMILQSVNVCDTISVKRTNESGIVFRTDSTAVPHNEDNIVVKAAKLFCDKADLSRNYEIDLTKKIPVEAGMAGGSADAAGILFALNKLNGSPLSERELSELALQLGADIPFCLRGSTMLAQGIGEKLTELPFLSLKLLIVKPEKGVSTKQAYEKVDLRSLKDRPNMDKVVEAIRERDLGKLTRNMGNVLYSCSSQYVPEIQSLIEQLEGKFGCIKAMMSGSGSTVFGIFTKEEDRRKAYECLSLRYREVFLAESTQQSIYVLKEVIDDE